MRKILLFFVSFLILSFHLVSIVYSQVPANEKRYIKIGSLQSFYSALGSERAFNGSYYEGLDWPANYDRQDNFVIRRQWIATNNFTDSSGYNWDKYAVYFAEGFEGISLYPVKIKHIAKFEPSEIFVDGQLSSTPTDIDTFNINQLADRIITNVVNTSLGLTVTRNIYAFSQQYHDNYFIKEFIFTNTGNVDYDDTIELNAALDDVYIGWGIRYSVCRDGASKYDNSQAWGKYSWVTKRGEDYPLHANDIITAQNPIVDWLRCGFSWAGQSDLRPDWNNIGAPDRTGNGRLSSPQHAGVVTLHVDSTALNNSDNPHQPHTLGWHAGDTYPYLYGMSPSDEPQMIQIYSMLQGNPHGCAVNGGNDRFYENNTNSIIDPVSPWTIHNDGGGTNVWACYGPFDLAHGESIRIVEAEGVNGLNRQMCEQIGAEWKHAYDDPSYTGPFTLPDGSTTTNKDIYKNSWVYTGWDSVMLTFSRAKRNFDLNYNIPPPPPPPATFEVLSDTNFISLNWADNASTWPNFAGYKLYRAIGKPDTAFNLLFECGLNTNHPAIVHSYIDTSVFHGFTYYYYVVSNDDGTTNTAGIANPTGPLHSGKFYTLTKIPAFISNNPGVYTDLYVSPAGDNNNSGLSINEPLRTITEALNRIRPYSLNPLTIYLSPGLYNSWPNGEQFPLNLKSYLTITGAGADSTIIDAEILASVFVAENVENSKMENLSIQNGMSDYGGGIKCVNSSNLTLSNVKIKSNHADVNGGGIYLTSNSTVFFDSTNRCNIFSNSSGMIGDDIYATSECPVIDIIVDTFSVISPSDYYAYPTNKFNFNILNFKIAQENDDLYASPTGDDNNTGLNAGVPLRTITSAIKKIIANSQNPHTIHLAQGTYNLSITGEQFPLYTKSYVSISGENKTNTILDGELNSNLIYCYGDNNLTLDNLSIINGFTTHQGGGIFCNSANLTLNNVLITKDSSNTGAGIYCDSSIINLSGVTIKENTAILHGGGIVFHNYSGAVFDSNNRCDIYNNTASSHGKDLYAVTSTGINVALDTFTVLFPTNEFAFPVNNFTYDINYGLKYQVNGDVYVSPTGDDNNTGTTAQDPLKTINYALDVIYSSYDNQHAIYLADGVYGPSANGDSLPIIPKEYVTISGNSEENTVLDGEGQFRLIEVEYLDNFSINNLTVQNGFAEDGGGVYCVNSNSNLYKVTFLADSAKDGGAIHLNQSDVILEKVIFTENKGKYGAAIHCSDSEPLIINSTFYNNEASTRGGAVENRYNSAPVFINSILWGDIPQEIYCFSSGLTMSHSDMQGGEAGIGGIPTNMNWLTGNKNENPLFVGGSPFNLNLTQNSPCVDAGTNLFVWQGDTIINMPDTSYFSSAPDMGAFESQFVSNISPNNNLIPEKFALYQNYPNPFNPVTKIKYDLPEKSEVKLIIYDLLGRKVRTLMNRSQLPGQKVAVWDALDEYGQKLATGMYIYKLIAGDFVKSRKMLLMK